MKTGTKIALCRKKSGLSQEQLALKLNISRQAVSRWETGEAIPDTEKIIQLSKLFHVSTDYLLLEEVEEIQSNNCYVTESVDTKPSSENKLNKKNFALAMLIVGVVCNFGAIIAAGIDSEYVRTWYYTEYGAFGTSLFFTWRAFFLYVGIGLFVIGFWILADIGKCIKKIGKYIVENL